MMEQLVDKIYSVYTERLKDKKYHNEDSIITLEQQDDGKWFVTDIKDVKQEKYTMPSNSVPKHRTQAEKCLTI